MYKNSNKRKIKREDLNELKENDINRLIEMAWQDRTTFDTIFELYGLTENQLKNKMRSLMKKSSFKMWRKRVSGRVTKHKSKVLHKVTRFKGPW